MADRDVNLPSTTSSDRDYSGLSTASGNRSPEQFQRCGDAVEPVPRSHIRWWLAVVGAMVASLPLTWLLSFAALLPFQIGLFFFVLFGLMIGAVTHRIVSPGRPYHRWVIIAGTTVLVAQVWTGALLIEIHDFPGEMAQRALQLRRPIGDRTPTEYRTAVADQVRTFLKKRYPPGGAVGYARWMLLSGRIRKGELADVDRTLRRDRSQVRFWYVVRLVLSMGLLAFGIGSQTFPLRRAREPVVRAIDEVPRAGPSEDAS